MILGLQLPAALQTSLPSERTSHFLSTYVAFRSLELFGMCVCGCKCVCVSCVYECVHRWVCVSCVCVCVHMWAACVSCAYVGAPMGMKV